MPQRQSSAYTKVFSGLYTNEVLDRLAEACRSKGPALGFALPYMMPLEVDGKRVYGTLPSHSPSVPFRLGTHPFAVFDGQLAQEDGGVKLTGRFTSGLPKIWVWIVTWLAISALIDWHRGIRQVVDGVVTALLTLLALGLLYGSQIKIARKMVLEVLDEISSTR